MPKELSNREIITEKIVRYMDGLPEPKSLPREIRVEIRFEEATETHCISLATEADVKNSTTESAEEIAKMYNEICKDLPKVRALTPARKTALRVRLRKYNKVDFEVLFIKAQESDFLCGRNNRTWTANFDWLLNESNIAKVLEGNYDNREKSKTTRAGTHSATSFDVAAAFEKSMNRTYGG